MRVVPTYVRRASALHSARAGVASVYCAVLGLVALAFPSPVVALAAIGAILVAGLAAGVGRELAHSLRLALPFVVLIVAINALVSREGLTVVFRFGEVLGRRIDVTAEALAWGAVTGLRLACLFLAFGLYAAVVDPDEMLRLMRRLSYRSALTASIATRLVPVLARDASRKADAARCRPTQPGRLELTRSTLAGALERAVEVAAALEVRGYAAARPPRHARRAWSRHDVRIAAVTVALVAAVAAALLAGVGAMQHEPTLRMPFGPGEAALALALVAAGAAPFAGAQARLGVARA